MHKNFGLALIVDDDPSICLSAQLLLSDMFAEIQTFAEPDSALHVAATRTVDIVLLDMNFARGVATGAEGLRALKQFIAQDLSCVVITAHGDIEVAVKAMKLGATDFVQKPWRNEGLLATVSTAATMARSRREAAQSGMSGDAAEDLHADQDAPLIGASPAMRRLREQIARAAPTDASVLILGESGTGKELVARELHRQSQRKTGPLVSVDLGVVAANLVDSELFGHVKGAFTDARSDRVGRFEAANRGTLFLDELGNFPLVLQPKLLTALEQRQITRLGSNRPIPIDTRIISATNMARQQIENPEILRQDLLFRLNTIVIMVPSLKDRRSDIPLLLNHFLNLYTRKYGQPERSLSDEICNMLFSYSWPGNVRELRHIVERAVIMGDKSGFSLEDFSVVDVGASDIIGYEDLNLGNHERRLLKQALSDNDYNISLAARALGLTRYALYRRMEKYGL
jgi:DNA-binding NtrC family response regulator